MGHRDWSGANRRPIRGIRLRDGAGQRRQCRTFDAGRGLWAVDRWLGQAAPDRRGSCAEVQAVRLADNRILGDAEASAYFGSGMALLPQIFQDLDRLVIPHHILVPLGVLTY
jgi:hypothetical protein